MIRDLVIAGFVALGCSDTASAIVQYQKVFIAEYCDDHEDQDFAKFVKRKGKCYICHQGRKDRENNNTYGEALAKYLDHKKDKDDVEKILDALRKVEKLPFNPEDPEGETFGQRIANSKLPAGELEDLKKEPAKESPPVAALSEDTASQ